MERLRNLALQLFNIHLASPQLEALAVLERELILWNEKVNLTAIRDPEGIRIKHFLDSFSCVLAWKEKPPARLIDIGTGAGFPGLPLKILYPSMRLTLVESIGKKTAFCRHMVEVFGFDGVEVITARAETVGRDPAHRQSYDWAVARAVAGLPVLVEYLVPLVHTGGAVLAQKGQGGLAEARLAEKAVRILGGKARPLIPIALPGIPEERYLIIVDKITSTPSIYPRLPGTPSKKPL
jgi:16S rRNA (guanine527-N7)-methyltransferase